MRRPNIVLIYTDQQRWDALHAMNPLVHTPHLDALTGRGALFENAFVNSPVCMPSRQSMLSGLYPSVLGTTCNGIEMPETITTLPHMLNLYGYHTANIGKLHFRNHSNRDHRALHPSYGFAELVLSDEPGCYDDAYIKWVQEKDLTAVDLVRCSTPPAWTGTPQRLEPRETHTPYVFRGPEELSHTAFVAEETCAVIERHRHEPFFVIAGIYAPHCPINPPQRFVDMYDPHDMPAPAMNPGENRYGLSDDAWRHVVACYYALVTHIDDQIGRILATLERTGLCDDTLVIFTSDHGEHLGDHGLVGKSRPYDSCSRVPLIMSLPQAIATGTRHTEIVEHVDVVPTIVDYCGIQVPPQLQGRSVRSLLEGRPYEARTSAFIEHHLPGGLSYKAVRTPDRLYAMHADGHQELYDLAHDPAQLHNVAGEPAHRDALHDARAELLRRWFDVQSRTPMPTGQY